jgi:hypothetical protein
MNKLIRILLTAGLCGVPAFATVYGGQVDTTSTTLSAVLTASPTGQVCVASATNVNVPSVSQAGSILVFDKEADQVLAAGSSTTCFVVSRGFNGSAVTAHLSGRKVWVTNVALGSGDSSRPFSGGALASTVPSGTCTASLQYSLPIIYIPANNDTPAMEAIKYYCFAGVWTDGQEQQGQGQSPYTVWTTYPTPGNVVAPVAVTDVSGKLWFSQIWVGYNSTATGACILGGSGAGTDAIILALWDATGNLLANTALAGSTAGSASLLQCLAFVSPITLAGGNSYFIGVQGNGTTAAQFSAYKTGGAPTGYLTGVQTGGSFGTILNITSANIPTGFNTGDGPYMSLY